MHFRGINNIAIDAKGRMAMPARYRESLLEGCGGRLVVTVDRDHCLLVYPPYFIKTLRWPEIT